MDFVGIVIGFFLGLVSSWLFWRWQLIIKPEFKISPQVAVIPYQKDPSKLIYQIKISNQSKRSIINMTASLGIHEVAHDGLGPGRRTVYKVDINPKSPTYVGPKTRLYNPWSITRVHYYTSKPDNKVANLLTDNRKLVFTVQATDAQSGTTVLKRVLFESKDLIMGRFEGGRKVGGGLRIVQVMSDGSESNYIKNNVQLGA